MADVKVYYDPSCPLCGEYLETIDGASKTLSHTIALCSVDDDPCSVIEALIEARAGGHVVSHLPLLRVEISGSPPVYYDGILEPETILYILEKHE